jgi:hypothetical protein
MIIKYGSVTVRTYNSEVDYSAAVEEAFAKFQQSAVKDYRVNLPAPSGMNHVEAAIVPYGRTATFPFAGPTTTWNKPSWRIGAHSLSRISSMFWLKYCARVDICRSANRVKRLHQDSGRNIMIQVNGLLDHMADIFHEKEVILAGMIAWLQARRKRDPKDERCGDWFSRTADHHQMPRPSEPCKRRRTVCSLPR